MIMNRYRQLTLNLSVQEEDSLENFVVGDNGYLIEMLKDFPKKHDFQLLYLYSDAGNGKTHLLNAVCRDFERHGLSSIYLPMDDHPNLSPNILDQVEQLDLVCIDNFEYICGHEDWEAAIFRYFEQASVNARKLVVSANKAPQHLPLKLLDLKSRLLGLGLVFPLRRLNDEQKLLALRSRANFKGLELNHRLFEFLLKRYNRNIKFLFELLDKLEEISLVSHRKITPVLVKEVLQGKLG